MSAAPVPSDYRARSEELEAQLREALETIQAIRSGEVDAVVIGGDGDKPLVYTLQDADRPYRLLIEQMQEGALTLNRDGVVLYANKAFAVIADAPTETLIGHPVGPILSAPWLSAALRERSGRGEAVVTRADGSSAPVKISFAAIEGDDDGLVAAVVTDLSEERRQAALLAEAKAELARRESEAALRESEARLSFTLKAGRLGAWDLDLATGALTATETCRTNFGRRADEPFTYEDVTSSVHPDDRERMHAAVQRALDGRVDYDIEYRVIWPNGELRWVQIRGRAVYAEDGTPLRMTGVSLDITDRRRSADDLQRLNETLETRVVDEVTRRGQVEDALRQSQKMEAVGQLTGGVAHDFNNLLTIVRSSVDFLRRTDLPAERRQRYIDAIADTVDRAAKLTGQLLSFARRQALKPEIFDVNVQVHSVGDMLRTIVGARVDISVEVDERSPCFVEADVSQFETAVVNLAVNGRDAMNGEGVLTIRVSGIDQNNALARTPQSMIRIDIQDTGVGIAPGQIKQIFEPFFTTKEVGKGTGLGLSQAYGFAKQSGGDLTVRSVLGQGATFTILLPRSIGAEDEAKVRPVAMTEAMGSGHGQWVLVVEDNNDVGAFSTQMLQDLGYNTVWANNAKEALDLLRQEPRRFDLVFSDIVMPGMGGVELGQEINRLYPGLPVLLTSGYSDVLVDQGRLGFELLQKPYAADDLSRLVNRTVRNADRP